jgi:PTS system mannose-specific IIA component
MIGLVVVTHARLAAELLATAEMVIGPVAAAMAVSIDRGLSVESARDQLAEAISRVGGDGDGVLILTDMFGGTPTNISAEFLENPAVEILTGVNLPMLIKAVTSRGGGDVNTLAAMLKEYARSAVMRPSELLRPAT